MAAPIVTAVATKLGGLGFFKAAAVVFKYKTLIATAINIAGAVGLSRLAQSRQELPETEAPASRVLVQGGTIPANIVYGDVVVGAGYGYVNVDNRETSHGGVYDTHYLLLHAERPGGIDSVVGYYLDGDWVPHNSTFFDEEGIKRGKWGKQTGVTRAVYVKAREGRQVGRDGPHLLAETFGEWAKGGTARAGADPIDDLQDICFSHWRFRKTEASEELFANGVPSLRVRLRGNRVYDPRKDSTRVIDADGSKGSGSHRFGNPKTWEWSDNPQLVYADYKTQYEGKSESEINWQRIAADADWCDEEVAIPGGTEKRCRIDISLSGVGQHKFNIARILETMGATQAFVGGRYSARVPRAETATVSLDSDNVIDAAELVSDRFTDAEAATITGAIDDRDMNFEETAMPAVTDPELVTENNQNLAADFSPPGVTRRTQWQRLAYSQLRQQRARRQLVAGFNYEALDLVSGARANLEYSPLNVTGKWRALEMTFGQSLESAAPIQAVLVEDSDSLWEDMPESEYSAIDPDGTITRPDQLVFPPTDLAAIATINAGEILVSWTKPATEYDAIRVYASPDGTFAKAEKVFDGDAENFLHVGISGDDATARTRYYWATAVRARVESKRTPDSDTSTVSATANEGRALDIHRARILKRSANKPSDRPTGNATYTRATRTLVLPSAVANGWSVTDPDPDSELRLWAREAFLVADEAVETIPPAQWSEVVDTADPGSSFGLVDLWTANDTGVTPDASTLPAQVTYTYLAARITAGLPASSIWKTRFADLPRGKFVYRAAASIAGFGDTATILRANFSIGLFFERTEDGHGQEYIARIGTLADRTLFLADPANWSGRPDNAWGFESPVDPWFDNPPENTRESPVRFDAFRNVVGTPAVGALPHDDEGDLRPGWSNWRVRATIAFGKDGNPGASGPSWRRDYTNRVANAAAVATINDWALVDLVAPVVPIQTWRSLIDNDGDVQLTLASNVERTKEGRILFEFFRDYVKPENELLTLFQDNRNWIDLIVGIQRESGDVGNFRMLDVLDYPLDMDLDANIPGILEFRLGVPFPAIRSYPLVVYKFSDEEPDDDDAPEDLSFRYDPPRLARRFGTQLNGWLLEYPTGVLPMNLWARRLFWDTIVPEGRNTAQLIVKSDWGGLEFVAAAPITIDDTDFVVV